MNPKTSNKKIIVIEDEALIADHIEMTLKDEGYNVIGVFDNAETVFEFLVCTKPDIILLDINLNGSLDGVDIAHKINQDHGIPIIYLTSNTDTKTIDRVKYTKPAGFITKPYTTESLISNIEIALHKNPVKETQADFIFIKDKGALIKIFYNDILYLEAMDNYSVLFTASKKHILPQTLKSMAELLEPFGFIKTHRSYLVNKSKISAIHAKNILIDKKEIPLSENLRTEVLTQLNTL